MLLKPTNKFYNNLGSMCELVATEFTEIKEDDKNDIDIQVYKSNIDYITLQEVQNKPIRSTISKYFIYIPKT